VSRSPRFSAYGGRWAALHPPAGPDSRGIPRGLSGTSCSPAFPACPPSPPRTPRASHQPRARRRGPERWHPDPEEHRAGARGLDRIAAAMWLADRVLQELTLSPSLQRGLAGVVPREWRRFPRVIGKADGRRHSLHALSPRWAAVERAYVHCFPLAPSAPGVPTDSLTPRSGRARRGPSCPRTPQAAHPGHGREHEVLYFRR